VADTRDGERAEQDLARLGRAAGEDEQQSEDEERDDVRLGVRVRTENARYLGR
jgi:hypothetical protein